MDSSKNRLKIYILYNALIHFITKLSNEAQGKNRLEINKELKKRMNVKDIEYVFFVMIFLKECYFHEFLL